jgi:hypothetical protein
MPKCTVCGHGERAEIDRALVRGEALRALARRYGMSRSALLRHMRNHIPADLARVAEAGQQAQASALVGVVEQRAVQQEERGLNVLAELGSTLRGVNKLFAACDSWLTDPEDPERYDLGPRAEELLVHYWKPARDGQHVRAKAPLSELLALTHAYAPGAPSMGAAPAGSGGVGIEAVELRGADPRELILKVAKRLEAELQLVARLLGQLPVPTEQGGSTVNVLVASPEWLSTRAAILAALEPYPEARAAVLQAVRRAARVEGVLR